MRNWNQKGVKRGYEKCLLLPPEAFLLSKKPENIKNRWLTTRLIYSWVTLTYCNRLSHLRTAKIIYSPDGPCLVLVYCCLRDIANNDEYCMTMYSTGWMLLLPKFYWLYPHVESQIILYQIILNWFVIQFYPSVLYIQDYSRLSVLPHKLLSSFFARLMNHYKYDEHYDLSTQSILLIFVPGSVSPIQQPPNKTVICQLCTGTSTKESLDPSIAPSPFLSLTTIIILLSLHLFSCSELWCIN